MEQKILEILVQIQEQMKEMRQDITSIKASVETIELQQNADVISILERIDNKTEILKQRQDEADNVIDVLAARTIRLEAKMNPH